MRVNVADRHQLQGDDDSESGGNDDDTINFGLYSNKTRAIP
jgi:hypothetical protein